MMPQSPIEKFLCWINSPLFRQQIWQRWVPYWKSKRIVAVAQWQLFRSYLTVRNRTTGRLLSTRMFVSIFRSVAGPAILACLTIGTLSFVEQYLHGRGIWVPESWRRAGIFRPESYSTLLAMVAQVTGVFLGLYFTAVSAVASAAYARVPNTVRALVIHEKVGNVYIRLVAFEAALAVLLLAAYTRGWFLGYLNLALVSFGAVFSIFAFVVLGFRAFYFFDPTQLAWYLERALQTAIISATKLRRGWTKHPLQMAYQRQAASALSGYRDLVIVATQAMPAETEALLQLAGGLCRSLGFYSIHKNQIPSDSFWFAREYRHPDWFSTDYTSISVALQTGTSLQPKERPDLRWFEKRIAGMLDRIIRALVKSTDSEALTRLAVLASETLNRVIPEDALFVFDRIAFTFSQGYLDPQGTVSGRSHLQTLNLATAQSYIPAGILLGFAPFCGDENQVLFRQAVGKIDWRKQNSIYRNFPRPVTKELEQLASELRAETQIEGTSYAPEWFVTEHVDRSLAEYLASCATHFAKLLDSFFIKAAQASSAEGGNLARGPIVQAGLEYCEKLGVHLGSAKSWFDKLTSSPSREEIPWPATDWQAIEDQIATARETLLTMLAEAARALQDLPIEDYPDYFGQLYSFLAQECYQALAQSNEARFVKLFTRFFEIAFWSSQRIREQVGLSAETKLLLLTDPLNDLIDLSGFAFIYSELDGKPKFARTTAALWDQHFTGIPDPQRTQQLQALASWKRPIFRTTPRDMVRMGWKQHLDRVLREKGLLDDMWDRPRVQSRNHSSPLIRAICQSPFVLDNAGDVFVVEYLLMRTELQAFTPPNRRTRELQKDVEREQNGNRDADE
jgi:hypothetical protein